MQWALTQAGYETVRIDGSVPVHKRGGIIREFASSGASSPRIMLLSLKAGAVGLNLTAAANVHLLDPWWNAALELQAGTLRGL